MNRINDWDKQILTAQDIARIFKCGKNLAYKIIESDDMNAVRIGSTVRVSMKSFNEWIDNKGFLLNNEETFDNQVYTLEEIKEEEIEYSYHVPKDGFIKIKELGILVDSDVITIEKYRSLKKDSSVKAVDFDKIKGGITVRNRQPGDKIKLKGGTKKIKDLFIDLKIPREMRNRVPIVVDEEEVILAGEYRMNENYKIDENTKKVLKLSIKKL